MKCESCRRHIPLDLEALERRANEVSVATNVVISKDELRQLVAIAKHEKRWWTKTRWYGVA